MKFKIKSGLSLSVGLLAVVGIVAACAGDTGKVANASDAVYGKFPVTEKSYSGSKTNSVSYTGQIARHVLHDSLKKLAGKGNGSSNPALKAKMMAYYSGKSPGRQIIAPATKGKFVIKQTMVDQISKKKNLIG